MRPQGKATAKQMPDDRNKSKRTDCEHNCLEFEEKS